MQHREDITLYCQPHLNLLVVCVASFVLVFLMVFLLMVFLALRLKRKQQQRRGQSREPAHASNVSQHTLCNAFIIKRIIFLKKG